MYRSIHHPDNASPAVTYARWLRGPLGYSLTPVLIVALILALTSGALLGFLIWSVPLAYLLASGWTIQQLRRKIAEVSIRPGAASIRSIWQVSAEIPGSQEPLLRVLFTGQELEVSVGQTVYALNPAEWPEYSRMETDLNRAVDGLPPVDRAVSRSADLVRKIDID